MAARPAPPPAFSTHSVSSVALSGSGALLAAAHGADDGTLSVTRVPKPSVACTHLTPGTSAAEASATGVTGVAWDGDARIYTGDERGALSLYTLTGATLACARRVDAAHSGAAITGIAAGPGLVATAGKDGLVKAWDPATGSCVARLKGHRGEARAVAAAASDDAGVAVHLLASAGRDRTVRLWDVRAANARPVHVFAGHGGWVHAVALAGGANPRVLSCGGDKTVRVWSLTHMAEEAVLAGHEYRVWAVAADPAGEFAVSGSTDLSVRCWSLGESPQPDADVWLGHGDSVVSVAVARDASVALSSSENGSVVLWDVARMRGKAPRSPASGMNNRVNAAVEVNRAFGETVRSPPDRVRPPVQTGLAPRTSPPMRELPTASNATGLQSPPSGAPRTLSESPRRAEASSVGRSRELSPRVPESNSRRGETNPRRVVSPSTTSPVQNATRVQDRSPRQASSLDSQMQSPRRTETLNIGLSKQRSPPSPEASTRPRHQALSPPEDGSERAVLAPFQPEYMRRISPKPTTHMLEMIQDALRAPSQSPPRAPPTTTVEESPSRQFEATSPPRAQSRSVSSRESDILGSMHSSSQSPRAAVMAAEVSPQPRSPRLVGVPSVLYPESQAPLVAYSPPRTKSSKQADAPARVGQPGQEALQGKETKMARSEASLPHSSRFFDDPKIIRSQPPREEASKFQAEKQSQRLAFFDAPSSTRPVSQSPPRDVNSSAARSPTETKSPRLIDAPSASSPPVQSSSRGLETNAGRGRSPQHDKRFFDYSSTTKPLSQSPGQRGAPNTTPSPPLAKSPTIAPGASRTQVQSPRLGDEIKTADTELQKRISAMVNVPTMSRSDARIPPPVEGASTKLTHAPEKQSPQQNNSGNARSQPISPPPRPVDEATRSQSTKSKSSPASPIAPISGTMREGRTHSPRSPVESSPSVSMGRIRFLEDQVAVRDKEIAARDMEIADLKREAELLKKQVAAAENLAKEANVRALGTSFELPRKATEGDDAFDETGPLNRIAQVTDQLKELAERLDEMVEDSAATTKLLRESPPPSPVPSDTER